MRSAHGDGSSCRIELGNVAHDLDLATGRRSRRFAGFHRFPYRTFGTHDLLAAALLEIEDQCLDVFRLDLVADLELTEVLDLWSRENGDFATFRTFERHFSRLRVDLRDRRLDGVTLHRGADAGRAADACMTGLRRDGQRNGHYEHERRKQNRVRHSLLQSV